MSRIRIAGIDKVKLLEALWAKQVFVFAISGQIAPRFDKKKAQEHLLAHNGYFDYFCGRRIKTDIGGDYANPQRYDDDPATGPGTFQRIVRHLKKHD